MSYDWSMFSKVTVNHLKLSKITQTIPDILASNASAQSSRSFWSGQFHFVVDISFNPFWKFLRLGNSASDFVRVNVWSRDFFGIVGSPRDFFGLLQAQGIFLGFDFYPHSTHSIIPVT